MLVFWLVLGLVLLVVESRHLAFYALFGAAGAFAAAIVAVLFPDLIVAQAAAAIVVAALGIWLVRPLMSNALSSRGSGALGRGVHGSLVGEEVLTLDEVGDAHHPGHVKLAGERWLAVSELDRPIPGHTRVLVTGVRGTTLIVWPVDSDLSLPDDSMFGLPPSNPDPEEK